MNKRGVAAMAAAVLVGAMAVQPPASAAATVTIALWQMNEAPGSRVLVDSSGNGVNGIIGAEVVLTGTSHMFGYL